MPATLPHQTDAITGAILAGGQGRRMGGADKGLVVLCGQTMAARAVARLRPQVDEIIINANRNIETYRALGHPVFGDHIDGFAGPLAGLHAALLHAQYPLVATVPCDSPFFPHDLVARLAAALRGHGADVAIASSDGQRHPVFCLCRRELAPRLADFLHGGGRRFGEWFAQSNGVEVTFDAQASAFSNINTAKDLSRWAATD